MIKFKAIKPAKGAIEKQAWDAYKKQITGWLESKLKDVECPTHHERPKVTVSGSIQHSKFTINGCCQILIDKTSAALK